MGREKINSVFKTKSNIGVNSDYVDRFDSDIDSANIFNINTIKYIYGYSGIGKTYWVKNLLNQVATQNIFDYIFEFKTFDNCDIDVFLDKFLSFFGWNDIGYVSTKNKISYVDKFIKNKKIIVFIDSFERTMKKDSIIDFILSHTSSIVFIITSTIKIELNDCTYFEINEINKRYIKKYAIEFCNKRYPQKINLLKNIDWQLFAEITKGVPNIITKTLNLFFLGKKSINEIENDFKSSKVYFDDNNTILDYIWKNEIADNGKRIISILSIIRTPVSLLVLENLIIGITHDKILKEISQLERINFIEKTDVFYSIHDSIFHYVNSYVFSNNNNYKTDLLKDIYKFSYSFLEKYAKDSNNYEGYKIVNFNFHSIWFICSSAFEYHDTNILKYWDYLENFLYFHGYYLNRIELGNEACAVAKEVEEKEFYAKVLIETAESEWFLYKNISALNKLAEAIMILKTTSNYYHLGLAYYYTGRIYRQQPNLQLAKSNLKKSLGIGRKNKDAKIIGFAINNLGNVDILEKKYYSAIRKFNKCLKIWESINDRAMIGVTYRNLLKVYRNKGEIAKAEDFYKKAFDIFEKLDLHMELAEVMVEMSELYVKTEKDKQKSLEFINKAKEAIKNKSSAYLTSIINDIEQQII